MHKMGKIKKFVWIFLIGILCSYIISNMVTTEQFQAERLWADGQVFELRESILTKSSRTWIYDKEQQNIVIQGNDAVKNFGKWSEALPWQCLFIEVDKLPQETMDLVFKHLDEKNQVVGQDILTVRNGENWFRLNPQVPFCSFNIQILGADGLSFRINQMKLTEYFPQPMKLRLTFVLIFVLYLAIVGIFSAVFGKRMSNAIKSWDIWKKIFGFLQFFYETICFELLNYKKNNMKRAHKRTICTVLFFVLFVYMLVAYMNGTLLQVAYYRYHALVWGLLLLFIGGFIGIEIPAKIEWNISLAKWWLILLGTIFVSDFAVSKIQKFVGLELFLVTGVLFFVWKRMKEPKDLLRSMMTALELLIFPEIIYLLLCRPKYDHVFYNGLFKTPGEFCIFSLLLFWVFCVEVYMRIRKEEKRKNLPFYFAGAGMNLYYIWQSGQTIGILTAIGILILLFVLFVIDEKIDVKSCTKQLVVSGCIMLAVVAVYHITAINHAPNQEQQVLYKGERFYSGFEKEELESLKEKAPQVYKKVIKENSNQRILLQKSYLRESNLFGHRKSVLKVWNRKLVADNSMLQILYRYGIFILIPYILFFWEYAKAVFFRLKKIKKCPEDFPQEMLFAGVLFIWVVGSFFCHIENPFAQPIWTIVYLMAGNYILERKEEL